ncbi:DMT family transporter [Microbacterium sp. SA39]|uniref:DMT family transporter n=1 Tax=Microbacterium sp. SA39 TaxID=1263625 RepID=UPI0005FA631D|nr:DMT family transporter [Microbacterium sp. SA39]KJQ52770.1 putative DMT superfamily transporter inner membrane protein [Microbacterium sp. SA39]
MSKQIGILGTALTVAAAVAFVVTWSSGFLIAAIATVDVEPLTLLVWRFVPLTAILLIVFAASGAAREVTASDLRRQATIGLFSQFGYCTAVYAALAAGIATGTVALIDAVQPLVIAMLVGPLLGLRVRGMQWVGLIVGALGVVFVVQSQFGQSDAHPLVYLLLAVAMACLIVGTIIQRRSTAPTRVLTTLTVHATVTAVALVVLAAATGTLAPPASASFWIATALAAVFPTLSAYGLYWWLLRRIGITALNALLFLIAPFTAVAGALLLGESVTIVTVLGFLLCGVGVGMVLVSEARAARVQDNAASDRTEADQVRGAELPRRR